MSTPPQRSYLGAGTSRRGCQGLELGPGQPPQAGPTHWHPNTHSEARKREEGRTTGQNPACKSDVVRCPNVVRCSVHPRQDRYSCQWYCKSCIAAFCPSSPASAGSSPGSSEDCRESCAGKSSHGQFQQGLHCKNNLLFFFLKSNKLLKENGLSAFILVLFLPPKQLAFPPHLPGHYFILLFFFFPVNDHLFSS